MRFLSIYKSAGCDVRPPSPEQMARMGAFAEQSMRSGKLVTTGGCLSGAPGARVTRSGSAVTVTDGPFAESKEMIAGFAVLETASLEEAVALTKQFLSLAGDGECEVRQMFEAPGAETCVGAEVRAEVV